MSSTSALIACMAVLVAMQVVANEPVSDDGQVAKPAEKGGRVVQEMKIAAPSMSEEDQYGYTMPDQYRCDACKVVTHHLTEVLKRKNRRLQEWEYHEVFDETCAKEFSGYGVSVINGENVLSGPAIKRDSVEAGMGSIQMGGETWEKRLGEICRKFVYEKIGEDEVYDLFKSKGEVSSDLCFSETRDCKRTVLGPEVAPKEEKKAQKEKNSKSAKKKQGGGADGAYHYDAKSANMDVKTFMAKLAKKQGFVDGWYTKKRSFAEWEELFVQASKRISENQFVTV